MFFEKWRLLALDWLMHLTNHATHSASCAEGKLLRTPLTLDEHLSPLDVELLLAVSGLSGALQDDGRHCCGGSTGDLFLFLLFIIVVLIFLLLGPLFFDFRNGRRIR
ncbi:hypothetical protein EYF80_053940 [Liparis tanakae]|uniref:Uncharacterized protein n=1 Tax=Liparis tanakae TaxID=230148 RepID=A0A4Z2F470_9TELE|nr:hypothetical protein EYF80_053940 [Liparis tanakae]